MNRDPSSDPKRGGDAGGALRPGERIADRFEAESIAGTGGMGEVWRARDLSTGETVAVKIVRDRNRGVRDRFAREASVLAALRHPSIVAYVAHGFTGDGWFYLAMEWLEGESLAERLAREGLTIAESVEIVRTAADALGMAHHRGVVHRDIKPGNLFLVDREPSRVKVLDFGVARLLAGRSMTRSGMVLGTPGYLAPEQARGEGTVTPRADVFALGCVLYECLTGRATYSGEHLMAIIAKILLEPPPRATDLRSDIPTAIEAVLQAMLAKDPADRFADGAAVATALEDAAVHGFVAPDVRAPTRAHAAVLTIREQRLMSVVFVGVAAALVTTPEADASDTVDQSATDLSEPRAIVERFGGHMEPLGGRQFVATMSGSGAATDQAARAARCALALRDAIPGEPMALATGRAEVSDRWPVGEVIDRGVKLVATSHAGDPRGIAIDEVTAGLLAGQFQIDRSAGATRLVGERDTFDATRTLLGKATPCVGREREIAALVGLYDECVEAESPRVALVIAGAGVGKSRLRYEVLDRLQKRDEPPEILFGRGDPVRAGAPFALVSPAVRHAAGFVAGESMSARRAKLRARVDRHVDPRDRERVTDFLSELLGIGFTSESAQIRAARADASLMADQLERAWVDWLSAETNVHPMLIVLDDLHWGDIPSVRFVDAAVRNLPTSRLMVLALGRPEVTEVFPALWSGRITTQIQLSELSRKASERLVRHALGDDVSDAMVERVVTQSGGNAFYLEELVRAVAAGSGDALPGTVMAMVQARLESLDSQARRALRAASVFGQAFREGGVRALVGAEQRTAELSGTMDDLVRSEFVARRGAGRTNEQDEFVFRHALVREAAYAMLTESDRPLGHRLAAEWLERQGEPDAAAIAEHYARAGESERAVRWFRQAAAQALDGSDYATAVAHAERGVQCGANGDELAALWSLQVEAHGLHGDVAELKRAAAVAIELHAHGSPGWYAIVPLALRAAVKTGARDDVKRLESALEEREALGDRGEPYIRACAFAAGVLYQAGTHADADALLAMARRACEGRTLEPVTVARVLRAESWQAQFDNDLEAALVRELDAVVAFERAGDMRSACISRVGGGYAWMMVGMYREAEAALREGLVWARRFAMRVATAAALQNLGNTLARLGAPMDEVVKELDESIEICAAVGELRSLAYSKLYLAQAYAQRGDYVPALALCDEAAETGLPDLSTRALGRALGARVRLRTGDTARGVEDALDAMEFLRTANGLEEGETLIRLAYAEALHARGQIAEARAAIVEARTRVVAMADRITNAEWRRAFLAVSEQAETLATADAWLAG